MKIIVKKLYKENFYNQVLRYKYDVCKKIWIYTFFGHENKSIYDNK